MQTKERWQDACMEQVVDLCDLVLYNDDVNTFDHVIETLIDVCKHDYIQATQCAHIVHYNGKCVVKSGSFNNLKPTCEALIEKGLSAVIN
jgi:ATP-dependent Clp protease adaptor protein ClpS